MLSSRMPYYKGLRLGKKLPPLMAGTDRWCERENEGGGKEGGNK
jgi:hypothetical protein